MVEKDRVQCDPILAPKPSVVRTLLERCVCIARTPSLQLRPPFRTSGGSDNDQHPCILRKISCRLLSSNDPNTNLISQTLSGFCSSTPLTNLTNSSRREDMELQLRANKHPVCLVNVFMPITLLQLLFYIYVVFESKVGQLASSSR